LPHKRDFRQEVTDNIVHMLEQGVAPWQKPWNPSENALALPANPTTAKVYRGGNAVHLLATGLQRGYDDPRWMTYKQAADQGWQVRKGEKGSQIEFWEARRSPAKGERPEEPDGKGDGALPGEAPSRLIHRVYTVFNAKQIDGIPSYSPKQHTPFEAVQAGERILAGSGAKVFHDQADRAFYSRAEDSIHLPTKAAFKDASGYYGTALHELGHWSGHPARLNRSTLNESYRFGDLNYAREELRAELVSVFLAAERGIPHDPSHHASYVGSWIKALKEDRNEIFRAAHDASAAADFLLELERDRAVGEERLTGGSMAEVQSEIGDLARDVERLDAAPSAAEQLEAERALTARALGEHANTYPAQTQSGVYRGAVIGETENYVLQRVSSRSAVAHPKELLDPQPSIGDSVAINYSNSRATVREFRERAKEQQLGR
jgi:antirestriction protein ArdC